uniref:FAD-dependent oxidoreductase n=1 Tax=Thaumasiovibrio occultus TaxID=1891184 RepID=UPI000B34E8A3|nr:FAD-dependent oxidoreductase [Thaumasiovibrio occultus]
MEHVECVVVGGGMVGAAAALGLAQQGKRVAVIESSPPAPFDATQPHDLRVSAISPQTVRLLEHLGVWESLTVMRLCPLKRLSTWELPECRTTFDAATLGMEWLGYIVENRVIQLALWQAFEHHPNLQLHANTRVLSILQSDNHAQVELDNGTVIDTQIVIAADGANSPVRQQTGIGVTAWDYRHHCMLINVTTDYPQQDITWQQFTPDGPRSFLPLDGQNASLVWYDSPARIAQLMQMPSTQLEKEIATHFPPEVGSVTVQGRGAFPLTRRHAQHYSKGRVVLMGDSAHTINPLAGQGVNLGFKDVAAFLELAQDEHDFSAPEKLFNCYALKRKPDNLIMQSAMDFFYGTFSNDLKPLAFLRNAGLAIADKSGPIKAQVLKYAMGL